MQKKTQIYQVKRRLVDVDVSSHFFGQSFPNSTIVYPIWMNGGVESKSFSNSTYFDIFSWSTVGPLYFHPSLLITWRSKPINPLYLPSLKLTVRPWKQAPGKGNPLLESIIFRCYVSLPECTTPLFITVLITSPRFSMIGSFFALWICWDPF